MTMDCKRRLVNAAAAGLALLGPLGASAELRELTFQVATPAKEPPVIDGALDDACWQTSPKHSNYYEYLVPNPRKVAHTKTDCRIVYDEKGVTVGICNWEDQIDKLVQRVNRDHDGEIWRDDSGEIFFDPAAAGIGFYRFTVNSLGKCCMAWSLDLANADWNWTAPGVVCAAKVFADRWEVELFVPWSVFHNRPAACPGDIWKFNHSRFRFGALGWGKGFMSSAPGASGSTRTKFGYLYFSDGTAPDARKVISILKSRLKEEWCIQIGEKTYRNGLDGVSEMNESVADYVDRLKREKAELEAHCTTNIIRLASEPGFKAKPIEMPLAGTYDLEPPKEYDGYNGWYRHNTVKDAYVTPHLEWCPNLIGGTPRVLFMTGFNATWRDMIELDERNALEPLYFPGNFGATGPYQDPLSHGTFLDKQAQFETLLSKNPQAVVFNGMAWWKVPSRYQYEILRRVRDEGMGLALLWDSGNLPDKFLRACTEDKVARRALAELVPYEQLPGARKFGDVLKGMKQTERLVRCLRLGKGRIVRCDMGGPGGWSLRWKAGYESRSAFQMNAIRWAAGEDPKATVTFASPIERDDVTVDCPFLAYEIDTKDSGVNGVRCRLRTLFNEVVSDERRQLVPGRNTLSLNLRKIPAGDYYLDLIPEVKGLFGAPKCDFAAVRPISKASKLGTLVLATTNMTVIAEGSKACLSVNWDAPLAGAAELEWNVYDTYRQLRFRGMVPLKAWMRSAEVRFDAANFPTLSGTFEVTICAPGANGAVLASGRKTIFFPNHRFPDYTMIVWESMWESGLHELFAPQSMDVFGYDCHLGEGGWLSAAFNGRAVPHITRVCLGGGRNGTSWNTAPFPGATNAAHRAELDAFRKDANIYRPEIRKLVEEGFTPRVKKCAPFGVSVYNLGDECYYSNDIGFGDAVDDGFFFDYLKTRYGTVEKYNITHKASIRDFKEVKRLTTDEAQKAGDWPAWFDQISYAAKMYSDTFQLCRSIIKKHDPKGRVGAEGSPSGNLDETIRNLEFWGPYGDIVKDEVLRSIAPDRVRGMWWGGYLARWGRNGFPGGQWHYLLSGRANADEWFAQMSGGTESAFAGDFTLAPYVQKLHANHIQLKRGLASFLIQTPLRRDPFAIYYSWASVNAATLSDVFPSPQDGCAALVEFCYLHGFDSTFVTPGSLNNLKDRKLLFLPGVCSLSDDEVRVLRDFAKRGGKLYADSEPGVLDGFLARRSEPPLKGLWTKYSRTAGEDELKAILATAGAVQTESFSGVGKWQAMLRTRQLGDMKCVGFTCHSKEVGKRVVVGLGRDGYIYEADTGFVKKGDTVVIDSLEKPFKLYAQFTEEQKPPVVALDRMKLCAGEFVSLLTEGLRQGSVYRIEVEDPDGRRIANREQVVKADAKTNPKIRFQFPYSDKAGTYKVILRDIATGYEGVAEVSVEGEASQMAGVK